MKLRRPIAQSRLCGTNPKLTPSIFRSESAARSPVRYHISTPSTWSCSFGNGSSYTGLNVFRRIGAAINPRYNRSVVALFPATMNQNEANPANSTIVPSDCQENTPVGMLYIRYGSGALAVMAPASTAGRSCSRCAPVSANPAAR